MKHPKRTIKEQKESGRYDLSILQRVDRLDEIEERQRRTNRWIWLAIAGLIFEALYAILGT